MIEPMPSGTHRDAFTDRDVGHARATAIEHGAPGSPCTWLAMLAKRMMDGAADSRYGRRRVA